MHDRSITRVNGLSDEEVRKKPGDVPEKTLKCTVKDFDPYDYGKKKDATSFWGVVGHIVVISLGPTLLSIPATFNTTGYVAGFLGTILTVFLYANSMRTLIGTEYALCKYAKLQSLSYLDVVEQAFQLGPPSLRSCSRYVQILIYAVFLGVWIGGNSVIYMLTGKNLKNSYDYFFEQSIVPESTFNLYLIIPLVVLCWIPNLKLLVPFSTFTNIVNAVCITLILYYCLIDLPSLNSRPMFASWAGFPMLMGVQLFSINATCLMIPFKNELRKPRKFSSKFGVITVAYVPVCVTYALFGLLCYLRYGEEGGDSVILNLPATTFNKTMIGLFGIGNCFYYPLIAYASFDVIWNNMMKDFKEKLKRPLIHEYVCRTLIAVSSIGLAYATPNLNVFLAFAGTVGTSIDSLMIPALIEMLIYYKNGRYYFVYLRNCIIIIIASILIVMGTLDCIGELKKTFQ